MEERCRDEYKETMRGERERERERVRERERETNRYRESDVKKQQEEFKVIKYQN